MLGREPGSVGLAAGSCLLQALFKAQQAPPLAAASICLQAEASERQAEGAADAVGALQAELARMQQQAALAGGPGVVAAAEVAAVTQTIDRLAVEVAGVKLLLAQQQEAAELAVAAARADSATAQERCVRAALSAAEQLVQQSSPASLATTAETAACLITLNDIVHSQQVELRRVQQGLASLEQAVGSAAEAGVRSTSAGGSGSQEATADTLDFLSAAVEQLQGQLGTARAAAEQGQAAQAADLAALRQQLAAWQLEAAASAGALRQDVADVQRHLAVVEESSEGALGEAPLRCQLVGVQRRLAGLEGALAQHAQHAQHAQQEVRRGEAAAADTATGMAALQSHAEGLGFLVARQQLHNDAQPLAGSAQYQPAEEWREVDSRMRHTEETVAAALEQLTAQMAALTARMDAGKAGADAFAVHAQSTAVAMAASAQGGLVVRRASSGEQRQAQLSTRGTAGSEAADAAGLNRQLPSRWRQQSEPSYGELHRQRSASRTAAQAQQGKVLGSPRRARQSDGGSTPPAASREGAPSASPGLFARLSRSLSGHSRRSSSGQDAGPASAVAQAADSALDASPVAAAAASGVGSDQSQQEGPEEVSLRVRYSASCGQEAGWEGSSAAFDLGGTGIADAQPSGAAPPPPLARHRSRSSTDSSGGGTGSSTPRSTAGPGKYTPRSRHWASLQQERSADACANNAPGPSSTVSTPRQPPSAFSSFGELTLPASASSALMALPP